MGKRVFERLLNLRSGTALNAHRLCRAGEIRYRSCSQLRAGLEQALSAPTRSVVLVPSGGGVEMIEVHELSRAMVHSAWMVYIALPSPTSAITGRSGQAIAAPVALGRPWPIAPPVRVRKS